MQSIDTRSRRSPSTSVQIPTATVGYICCAKRLVPTLAALGILIFVAAPRAEAALGATEASVKVDQTWMEATRRVMPTERLTVHELKTAGTTVREFVSPAGMVFGVAWQGAALPDLRQLLGVYFDPYLAAAASRHTRRAPVLIELPGLVVHSSGHMRAFEGKAYLPQSLPPGVSAEDVQ
jgi:Protein of unknown function (DUF2844)